MRMYDIIAHKRDGMPLSNEEIAFFVQGFTKGDIPDYQAAALLMAVFLKGMDDRETACLTQSMASSGDLVDLSAISGIKVDKHSTGGVGDKTSLIVCPVVAACGAPVAKMSGRGLGHSGGTIDKLESIPGFQTEIHRERFLDIVREHGLSIIGQSGNIAPADKKIYALRDVTATVESLPLIASSIMSKKLAAGADAILLDVKTGSGAFMKTLDESIALGKAMVEIGRQMGRRTTALVTDMDAPLGYAIGNALEVAEAVDVLCGRGPEDLLEVCTELSANMLVLAEMGDLPTCRDMARHAITSGEALSKLKAMVTAQGGDALVLEDFSRLPKADITVALKAETSGVITGMDTEACGIAAVVLGAGRARKEDSIDFGAGILLSCKVGELVSKGDELAVLHTSSHERAKEAVEILRKAIRIGNEPPKKGQIILARITGESTEIL